MVQNICVNVHIAGGENCIANVYIHANGLCVDDPPCLVFSDYCVLLGDLNARHKDLGTEMV